MAKKTLQSRYSVWVRMNYVNDDNTYDGPAHTEEFIVNAPNALVALEKGETAAANKYPSEYNEYEAYSQRKITR